MDFCYHQKCLNNLTFVLCTTKRSPSTTMDPKVHSKDDANYKVRNVGSEVEVVGGRFHGYTGTKGILSQLPGAEDIA